MYTSPFSSVQVTHNRLLSVTELMSSAMTLQVFDTAVIVATEAGAGMAGSQVLSKSKAND